MTVVQAGPFDNKLKAKESVKIKFDRHTRPTTSFIPGARVCVRNPQTGRWDTPAEIVREVAPRSYAVNTDSGSCLRRTSRHLKPIPTPPHCPIVEEKHNSPSGEDHVSQNQSNSSPIRKSDRRIIPPRRLIEKL